MGNVYVGPAGWAYDDWRGIVYPRGKSSGFDPLDYLSRFFDCIEINSTFYRIPFARVTAGWVRRVGGNEHFRFTLKLHRSFTHEIGQATVDNVRAFHNGIKPIVDTGRLGCVLVQFPWSFKNTTENSGYLRRLFGEFEDVPLVLEVRHLSWNAAPVYDFLAERGVGFCNIDQPLFHGSMKPSARSTSPVGYFRLHGQNYENWFREGAGRDARYDYLYSEEGLEPWAERVERLRDHVSSVYVIMNNHFKGKAVCNALQMRARLSGEAVEVPAPLIKAFPQLEKIAVAQSGQGEMFA
jgi:uncharacterized protein YecE (DUF72 family)